MYFTAHVDVTKGAGAWTESLLISAVEENDVKKIALDAVKAKHYQPDTAFTATLREFHPVFSIEYKILSKVLDTYSLYGVVPNEPAMPHSASDFLMTVADHAQARFAQQGVLVRHAQIVDALAEVLDEADWKHLACRHRTECPDELFERPPVVERQDVYGPRIEARFQPQAWMSEIPVSIDGECFVDVTAELLSLPLHEIHLLEDGSSTANSLVDVIDLEHSGPYIVEVVEQVRRFFNVRSLTSISEAMFEKAKARAFDNVEVSVEMGPQLVIPLASEPFTVEEMFNKGWNLDCVVAIPEDYPGNSEQIRAYVSSILTGRAYAIEGFQYQDWDYDYGPEHRAIRINGQITHPEKFFDLGEWATPRGDKESLRLLAQELNRADVFEMTRESKNTRYRFVCTHKELVARLLTVPDLSTSDWSMWSTERVAEFIDPLYQESTDEGVWFTLEHLATAKYSDEGTFEIMFEGSPVVLRFF